MPGIILYDFFAVMGGAERLIVELLRSLRRVDLCLGYRQSGGICTWIPPEVTCFDISRKCNIPAWRSIKLMHAFERRTRFIRRYEWALFSGTVAPLAAMHRPQGPNLYYCHTIPRYAYDLFEFYMSRLHPLQRPLLRGLAAHTRKRYAAAMRHMDTIVVNSSNVRNRLKKHLGLDSRIIHPPCETRRFKWHGQEDYYLSTARLEDFKRVDLVIRAFRKMPGKKLIIASGGRELKRLKTLAEGAANIFFTDWISESELRRLIGRAIATIYIPKDEDFGMSPVESMAAGKPVIGVAEGGLLETIIPGQTGLLISASPNEDELISAVERMTSDAALEMRKDCELQARRFATDRFISQMRELIPAP